jgi:diacylglycerol kinase family enzyme
MSRHSRATLLVANTTAQSGRNAERVERARGLFEDAGARCELLPTLPAGATVGAVRAALETGEFARVVAMGGDGTFREVAAALYASDVRDAVVMAMLPTGTANDQGRSFGLEAGDDALARNVEVAVAGHETRLDAGRLTARDDDGRSVREELFFDSAGWGISARILAQRNRDREVVAKVPGLDLVYRDKLTYAGATLKTFLESYVKSDKFSARIRTEEGEQTLSGLTDLIVKGTRVYGGAWVFDRHGRHDDGRFEMVPFRGKRDWTSKAIVDLEGNPITEELLNAVGIEHSKPFSFSRAELVFTLDHDAAPLAAQLDGEELIATPRATVEVIPRAIRLIVPRG